MFTFLPIVFYEQFKFFFNLYFLLVALSQFIPALKTGTPPFSPALCESFLTILFISPGFLVTYIAPLAFVLLVTMGKEAYDDYKRNLRDREANSARYLVLASHSSSNDEATSRLEDNLPPTRAVPSSSIRVGDLVLLEKNQRVPADLVLLRTSDSSGTCFIRTDQLDGETDWKLRVAVPATQKLPSDQELLNLDAEIYGALLPLIHQSDRLPLWRCSGCADKGDSHVHRHVYDQHTTQHILRRSTDGASTNSRTPLSRERTVGEHRTRIGHRYWFRGLHGARDACSNEHESPTDESWIVGLGDQQIGQGESYVALSPKVVCAYSMDQRFCVRSLSHCPLRWLHLMGFVDCGTSTCSGS